MVLYPTSELSKAAAKVLKRDLKIELSHELAKFLNKEFAMSTSKFAEPAHLKALVGRYYQQQSNLLMQASPEQDSNN